MERGLWALRAEILERFSVRMVLEGMFLPAQSCADAEQRSTFDAFKQKWSRTALLASTLMGDRTVATFSHRRSEPISATNKKAGWLACLNIFIQRNRCGCSVWRGLDFESNPFRVCKDRSDLESVFNCQIIF